MKATLKDENGKYYTEGDLPRDELVKMADNVIIDSGGIATVHFKFTCEKCGERCTFQEPNQTYEFGECAACGHSTPFVKGGFLVQFKLT